MEQEQQQLNRVLKCKKETVKYMKEILSFLNQYFWIYNGHMTKIFTETDSSFYKIPLDWRELLLNLSPEEMNELPFGLIKEDWVDSFKEFVKSALRLGCLRFLNESNDHYRSLPERDLPDPLLKGMSVKKIQEVEGMAKRVASICIRTGSSFVLDVGAGMGYLDQVLHYCYGLTVLGIDAAFSHGAQTRIHKSSSSDDYCSSNVTHVPFTLQHTEESLNELEDILNNAESTILCPCQRRMPYSHDRAWVVVALHACGDLTNSVLEFYRRCTSVRAVVCLSCCYHKMTTGAFPLSTCLQDCLRYGSDGVKNEIALSLYGLRLASQETRARWAIATPENHSERATHVLYRACIEYALSKRGTVWQRPTRRIGKQAYKNFQTYCDAALITYDYSLKIEAMAAYETFCNNQKLLERLTLLQVMVQPVLEVLILMDRACLLNFNSDDISDVWLEAVAPDVLSPRNIAILAVKDANQKLDDGFLSLS